MTSVLIDLSKKDYYENECTNFLIGKRSNKQISIDISSNII
jgi:hypothetical protein